MNTIDTQTILSAVPAAIQAFKAPPPFNYGQFAFKTGMVTVAVVAVVGSALLINNALKPAG